MFPNPGHKLGDFIDICPFLIFTILLQVASIIITDLYQIFSDLLRQSSKILNHDGIHLGEAFATIELIKDCDDAAGKGTNKNANSVTSTPLK